MNDEIQLQLRRLENLMWLLVRQQIKEMKELDDLKVQAQQTEDTDEAAIVVLNGLADQIAALKTDPAALQALSDGLKATSDKLAAAITTPPTA